MSKDTEVFLVGDRESVKKNQWLSMTNSIAERDRLMAEIGPEATTKSVVVKPRPQRRGK